MTSSSSSSPRRARSGVVGDDDGTTDDAVSSTSTMRSAATAARGTIDAMNVVVCVKQIPDPAEPGALTVLEYLELEPLLDLSMRLGEGTGGLLAVPLVQAAARALAEMATLEELGFG